MCAPPHSLHRLRSRWWGQMLEPPHSLQLPFRRWCLHRYDPPHSLQSPFRRWCGQMLDPPHSLHSPFRRWCGQMLDPPHSLHWLLRRRCWQIPAPPHSLHRFFRRPCSQGRWTCFFATPPPPAVTGAGRLPPTAPASVSISPSTPAHGVSGCALGEWRASLRLDVGLLLLTAALQHLCLAQQCVCRLTLNYGAPFEGCSPYFPNFSSLPLTPTLLLSLLCCPLPPKTCRVLFCLTGSPCTKSSSAGPPSNSE